MVNNKTDSTFIWTYLIELGKFELIDLMAKAEKHEFTEIKIKRALVPDIVIHNNIIKHLEKNGVTVIREDIKRDGRY